jgi:hypothetical protein
MDEPQLKQDFSDALGQYLVDWQPDRSMRARVRTELVGLHVG